ncbi:MAG: hypoxanthine phosphoribosyltransferase [Culicoidibacterales bacterium]
MMRDIEKVLITHEEIVQKSQEMGQQITGDFKMCTDQPLLLVGLLKGSVPFMSELLKSIDLMLEIDFMDVSSYHGGTQSTNDVRILRDLETSVTGRHVLIIEDIVDTGQTLKKVVGMLESRGAASVKVASLLDKPEGRKVVLDADYVGFTIPNEFVVGYGLDYNELYRNLPFIGILKADVYA